MPTSSQTDYEDGLKNVRLEASDSLSNLKNDPFVNDTQFYYDATKSVFEIVRLCLAKTALGLKINTINNTFANGTWFSAAFVINSGTSVSNPIWVDCINDGFPYGVDLNALSGGSPNYNTQVTGGLTTSQCSGTVTLILT
jgi:hypothetical protein